MIKSIHYRCIGSEVNDGINTELYFTPASGLKIIDTIVKGKSKRLTTDEETGYVLVDELLVRDDVVTIIYKTLPRNTSTSQSTEFDSADFTFGEFA